MSALPMLVDSVCPTCILRDVLVMGCADVRARFVMRAVAG
jgi:hypothetical protein